MIRHLFAALLAALTLNAFAAVDANQASRADLETVRGIGPSLSGKIVEARKAGEFKNWGDLVGRISGVGPDNAARLSQAGLTVAALGSVEPSLLHARDADDAARRREEGRGDADRRIPRLPR